jgi:hypothetical protein
VWPECSGGERRRNGSSRLRGASGVNRALKNVLFLLPRLLKKVQLQGGLAQAGYPRSWVQASLDPLALSPSKGAASAEPGQSA